MLLPDRHSRRETPLGEDSGRDRRNQKYLYYYNMLRHFPKIEFR
jgi:hypothetical protein